MTHQNAAQRADLPRPDVSIGQAAAILRDDYGLEGRIVELGSQQDRNFRIRTEAGDAFVLKISRAEYSLTELEAQNEAMRVIAAKAQGFEAPQPVATRSGAEILQLVIGDQACRARLLTYLEGEPLTRRKHLSNKTRRALGRVSAEVAATLADFDHPGLDRALQWDMRAAHGVTLAIAAAIADPACRAAVLTATEAAEAHLAPLRDKLRLQAVHHDVTDDNVVARIGDDGHPVPVGVIDFGDLMRGWLVGDLAVTCAALLHHADGDPFFILPAVEAFHAAYPLTESELRALWPLIVQRACVLAASGEQQLAVDPDNAYVAGNIDHEREILRVAVSLPIAVMQTVILDAVGALPAAPASDVAPLLDQVEVSSLTVLRLDPLSEVYRSGNWLEADIDRRLLTEAAAKTGFAATCYGERRLSRATHHAPQAPASTALGVDLAARKGARLKAPFAGSLLQSEDALALVGQDLTLWLTGAEPLAPIGGTVRTGEAIAAVGEGGVIGIQLSRLGEIKPQAFVADHQATAWKHLCPSPSALLGMDLDAPELANDDLMAVRQAHFAKPQKNYYQNPPQIERGWREQMYGTNGRAYLDMVNNVAILGHGHEKLSAAVGRQWSLLNTNSRFHYAGIADFSKRLVDLAPEGLDTVFLVNSGSEANDLALRLAWAHSGARNMLCLLEAYHGWTVASDAVSTSIADNPQALTTRPPWVHAVTSPNTYRGPYRGPESAPGYIGEVEKALARLDEKGEALAGFICECVYGNSGGIPLPKGYLKAVYDMVRARGGVTIADEVQVGYGRLGHYFWGFEEQSVTPDIITIAKGMGNGHPLGAVITSRAIADSLEKEGYFFSSAGGSPVSCIVGMTVLDALFEEKLQDNAREVGDHLKARLEALGQRFDLVGAVHGMGLYLGLEFVRDRQTLAPATVETARICDRLLDLGVIMQPTGDHLNVLKIKPPMCLSKASADYFVGMLARVLDEGW
ncbi:aminotransferase [Rhizobium sp. G21]|uniref:aminotransferase n=1 Tax=Rhizobium sp. G21 TaxID=2758439 RepID=UPI0016030E9D|nr:aminotransferase [Rhizobium sp. G21]MBB1248870.1 aminotransferase [Rhizobium sp. G21]